VLTVATDALPDGFAAVDGDAAAEPLAEPGVSGLAPTPAAAADAGAAGFALPDGGAAEDETTGGAPAELPPQAASATIAPTPTVAPKNSLRLTIGFMRQYYTEHTSGPCCGIHRVLSPKKEESC